MKKDRKTHKMAKMFYTTNIVILLGFTLALLWLSLENIKSRELVEVELWKTQLIFPEDNFTVQKVALNISKL